MAQRTLTVAPAQPNEQRIALVIGNAAYKEAPLRNPFNDATDVAGTLHRELLSSEPLDRLFLRFE